MVRKEYFPMSHPILITGAAGGAQGSTGRIIATTLLRQRIPVRALVSRSVAEQNTAFLPWGDGSAVLPLAGAEDVARVAAALLASPSLPSEWVYPLVSETPTVRDIVDTLSRVLGRPIRYVPITDEQWADAVKERLNPHALDHLSHLWQHLREGEQRYRATDTVCAVTGRNPQTLEKFFWANAGSVGADATHSKSI
jgi:hypothetical protein